MIAKKEKKSKSKKYLVWIIEKRIYFLSLMASIIFINVILHKMMPLFGKRSPEGYVLAHHYYSDWKDSSFNDYEKLNKIKYILRKYPSLKPKYEGLILQNLLIKENALGEYTDKFAGSLLERTKSELPLYFEFSKISILIKKKDYLKALEASKELKFKMLNDLTFLENESLPAGAVLYAFNLLRMAILEGKLNNYKQELAAWVEFEEYLKLNSNENLNKQIAIAAKVIKEIFNENNIELKDYILFRKNTLSSVIS